MSSPGALAVHADRDFGGLQHLGEVGRAELAALIGVEDLRLAMPGERLLQSLDTELHLQRDREPPGQDGRVSTVVEIPWRRIPVM